jgi:hypothetical protein
VLTKPEGEAAEPRSAQVIDLMELLKKSIDKTGARAPARGAKRAAEETEEAVAAEAPGRARKSSSAHKAAAAKKTTPRRKRA